MKVCGSWMNLGSRPGSGCHSADGRTGNRRRSGGGWNGTHARFFQKRTSLIYHFILQWIYWQKVEDIKTAIATIKSKVQDVDSFHSKALTSVTGDGEGYHINEIQFGNWTPLDHQRKLDELMESTNEYIQTTRQKLKGNTFDRFLHWNQIE